MADDGIGEGAFDHQLFAAQAGTHLGPDNRYQIVGLVRSTENSPFPVAFASYLAKDVRYVVAPSDLSNIV